MSRGDAFTDPTFNRDAPSATSIARNVRRVEPRNTPSLINAVFNHSNFLGWPGGSFRYVPAPGHYAARPAPTSCWKVGSATDREAARSIGP